MSDLSKLEQYMQLVDRLVQLADKEDLAECAIADWSMPSRYERPDRSNSQPAKEIGSRPSFPES